MDVPVEGCCWVCGMRWIDHTIVQADLCLDLPLLIIFVEDEDQAL
ncbi:MAG TPA: hypothetical protein VFJ69_08970 [Actinomycetota bacterium]|nr:hypothetical protein [Actinomycetota bacterium]